MHANTPHRTGEADANLHHYNASRGTGQTARGQTPKTTAIPCSVATDLAQA